MIAILEIILVIKVYLFEVLALIINMLLTYTIVISEIHYGWLLHLLTGQEVELIPLGLFLQSTYQQLLHSPNYFIILVDLFAIVIDRFSFW